jgi:hypothetical protein
MSTDLLYAARNKEVKRLNSRYRDGMTFLTQNQSTSERPHPCTEYRTCNDNEKHAAGGSAMVVVVTG